MADADSNRQIVLEPNMCTVADGGGTYLSNLQKQETTVSKPKTGGGVPVKCLPMV